MKITTILTDLSNFIFIKRHTKIKYGVVFILCLCFNLTIAQQNIAAGKSVSMSTIDGAADGHFIVDGKTEYSKEEAKEEGTFFSKTKRQAYQWIQIDLGTPYEVNKIKLSTESLEHINQNDDYYNTQLFLVVSDDPTFSNMNSPMTYSQLGYKIKKISISDRINITPVIPSMTGRYVRIWENTASGIFLTEVEVFGKLSKAAVANAVKNGNTSEANRILNEKINAGQTVDQEATLKLAIGQKSTEMITTVLSNNPTVSSEVFDYAINTNYDSNVINQLMSSGNVDINSTAVTKVINKRDGEVVKKMLREDKSAFNNTHVDLAFSTGQTEMAKNILNSAKLTPSRSAMLSAVKSGNILLVSDMINKYGGSPNADMLTEAIKIDNQNMVDLFLVKVKPNSEAYVLAAKKNDAELYSNLVSTKGISNNKSIEVAIDNDNIKILKSGLANGGKASSALKYAITKDRMEMVEHLITRKGIDVNPVIAYAVSKKNQQLFSTILNDYNADANKALKQAIDAKSNELAIVALETGKTEPSKYLKAAVEADNDILAKKIVESGGDPDQGMEAAIKKNKTNLVEYFIEFGASVKNPEFLREASKSNFTITKLLVDNGANANYGMVNSSGANKKEIVEFLLENGAEADRGILPASMSGHTGIVSLLLENGADANRGIEGAVKGNHTETSIVLLENGADGSPKILIQKAAQNNNVKLTNALLQHDALVENGLSSAVKYNSLEVFNVFLENGGDATDTQYMILAAKSSAYKIIPILAEQGIAMDYKSANGSSFMHISINSGNNLNTIMALIEAGSPIDAKDNLGNSVVHVAAMKGRDYIPTIQALGAAGADMNAVNNENKTPRKVAKHQRTKTAIKKLGGERKVKN